MTEGIQLLVSEGTSSSRLCDRSGSINEFESFRKDVSEVLRGLGSVSPPLERDPQEVEEREADFLVVDDWYGVDSCLIVEPKPECLSTLVVERLAEAAARHHGWSTLLNVGLGISLEVGENAVDLRGWSPTILSLDRAVEEIREHLLSAHRASEQHFQRRLMEVHTTVRSELPRLFAGWVELVSAYADWSDGTSGTAIWIFHRSAKTYFDLDDLEVDPPAMYQSVFVVRRSGEIEAYEVRRRTCEEDTGLLVEWIFVESGEPLRDVRRVRVRDEKAGREAVLLSEIG